MRRTEAGMYGKNPAEEKEPEESSILKELDGYLLIILAATGLLSFILFL